MITSEELKTDVQEWAKKVGVEPKEVHVREMTKKWASCSSTGRLTFSYSLLKEPQKVRSEVILHELLHLKYPNHGKMFKALSRTYLKTGQNLS